MNKDNKAVTEKAANIEPDTVNVDKSELAAMREQMEKQDKQISLLTKVANKIKMARHAEEVEQGTSARIGLYRKSLDDEPLMVISWRSVRDEVRMKVGGGIEEKQTILITLEDGTDIPMNLTEFPDVIEKEEIFFNEETVYNSDKSLKLVCFERKGKEYKILPQFINP